MTKPGHAERASQGGDMSFNKVATGLAVPVLVLAHMEWIKRVSRTVPGPYLDEVFHTPQANAFWQGNWSHWDDKITTPPGVYLWSILTSKLYWADTAQSEILSAHQTRSTNNVLPYMLAISILVWERSAGRVSANAWVSPRQLCVFAFPMIFFFSGLYYTDVFSALTVMSTYAFWQSSLRRERGLTKLSLQSLVLLSGLVSLASRQTNIFWIAIFPGGLQLVHTIKKNARIHDPLISEAYFEGMSCSCVTRMLSDNTIRFLHHAVITSYLGVRRHSSTITGSLAATCPPLIVRCVRGMEWRCCTWR